MMMDNDMRIGIISDVHGNAAGLQDTLSRLCDVDEVFCLGDIVEDFRFSNEACAQLADREVRCVLGNHDIGLLGLSGTRARSGHRGPASRSMAGGSAADDRNRDWG